MRLRETPVGKLGQLKAVKEIRPQDIKKDGEGNFVIQVGNLHEVEVTKADAAVLVRAFSV